MTTIVETLGKKLIHAEEKLSAKKTEALIWSTVGGVIALLHLIPETWNGLCALDPFLALVLVSCWAEHAEARSNRDALKDEIVDYAVTIAK